MRGFSFFFTKSCPKINFLFFLAGNAKDCYTGFIVRKREFYFRKITVRNLGSYRKFMLTEKDIIKGETKDDFAGIGKRSAKIA